MFAGMDSITKAAQWVSTKRGIRSSWTGGLPGQTNDACMGARGDPEGAETGQAGAQGSKGVDVYDAAEYRSKLSRRYCCQRLIHLMRSLAGSASHSLNTRV